MKKCLIFINQSKSSAESVFTRVKNVLNEFGCTYAIYDDKCEINRTYDLAIVVGGDGTFLKAADVCSICDIPIVGINLGRMGFLTTIDVSNLETELGWALCENYSVEDRMMIEIFNLNNVSLGVALNDISFKNSFGHGVGNFKIYINDSFMLEYYADGVLISTPTGSTAYSLSVGGPIVNPLCELMIINPISSHSLNSRSIIINSDDVVKVVFNADKAFVGVDGQGISSSEDTYIIKKSNRKCKLIKFENDDFYRNIFEKIK